MGCDIHLYTERKRNVKGKETWTSCDNFRYDPYDEDFTITSYYTGRNYALFTALANVRNRGDNIPVIAEPRGLPDDVSSVIKKEHKDWDLGAHSASHITLKELLKYQREVSSRSYSGLMHKDAAKLLDEEGIFPKSWCQGTNSPDYVHRRWSEKGTHIDGLMDDLVAMIKKEFWIWTDEEKELNKKLDELSDQFRIVFWFDN